jgi:hypothetical protein
MSDSEEEAYSKELAIKRVVPSDLQARFANDLVIQHQSEHFVLSFFEMFPPMIIAETTDEIREAYEAIEAVEARCVARIIVTPKTLKGSVDTLTKNVQNYEQRYGLSLDALEEEDDESI